jgi:hypothetical protein
MPDDRRHGRNAGADEPDERDSRGNAPADLGDFDGRGRRAPVLLSTHD